MIAFVQMNFMIGEEFTIDHVSFWLAGATLYL